MAAGCFLWSLGLVVSLFFFPFKKSHPSCLHSRQVNIPIRLSQGLENESSETYYTVKSSQCYATSEIADSTRSFFLIIPKTACKIISIHALGFGLVSVPFCNQYLKGCVLIEEVSSSYCRRMSQFSVGFSAAGWLCMGLLCLVLMELLSFLWFFCASLWVLLTQKQIINKKKEKSLFLGTVKSRLCLKF